MAKLSACISKATHRVLIQKLHMMMNNVADGFVLPGQFVQVGISIVSLVINYRAEMILAPHLVLHAQAIQFQWHLIHLVKNAQKDIIQMKHTQLVCPALAARKVAAVHQTNTHQVMAIVQIVQKRHIAILDKNV